MKTNLRTRDFAPDGYDGWHILRDFEDHRARFVDENRRTTRATRIVIDLHGAPRPLPFDYVKAIERDRTRSGSSTQAANHGSTPPRTAEQK
jgi:hypothetical protein